VAWLLVQLKLRLLRNALRSSTQAKVSFIISTTFAGLVAVGTFAGLAALRGHTASVDLTTVIFTLFAFGWLILPLLAFGLDGTLPRWPSTRCAPARWPWDCWPPRLPVPGRWPTWSGCSG
jgi:hypothetical protein